MKVLHFLTTGGTGGIESLMREYSYKSTLENYFVIFWGPGINSDKIKEAGGNVIELEFGRKAFFKIVNYLSNIVKKKEIDAIVTHHAAPLMWLVMYALKTKYPYLKTYIYAHGNILDMLRENVKGYKLRKKLLRNVFKKTNYVIAISNSVRNSFINQGFDADKIHKIYNGVDCAKFESLPLERKNDRRKIVFVGRLIPQKGVDRLISALSEIKEKNKFSCEIVGDGVAKKDLVELTKRLHLEENVTFLGTRSDIPEILSEADVFVHPAKWEEGFGIALVEAMSAGVIPVAFNKGAISEIIDDGINGFIINEESVEALAKTIDQVLENMSDEAIMTMRRNARKKADSFNMDIYTEQLDMFLIRGNV